MPIDHLKSFDAVEGEKFMRAALQEAWHAAEQDEVPVGAVVVHQGQIIGRGHNQREMLNDPTAHAEMIAITAAAASLGSWRLEDCTMYVTLEPCPMCAGALVQARIAHLVYGATDPKAGACGSLYSIQDDQRLNHRILTLPGFLADECGAVLVDFFRQKRGLSSRGQTNGY